MGGGVGCTGAVSSAANAAKGSHSAKSCITGGWKAAASMPADPGSAVTEST